MRFLQSPRPFDLPSHRPRCASRSADCPLLLPAQVPFQQQSTRNPPHRDLLPTHQTWSLGSRRPRLLVLTHHHLSSDPYTASSGLHNVSVERLQAALDPLLGLPQLSVPFHVDQLHVDSVFNARFPAHSHPSLRSTPPLKPTSLLVAYHNRPPAIINRQAGFSSGRGGSKGRSAGLVLRRLQR